MVQRKLPPLKALGDDLTETSVLHRIAVVTLPIAAAGAYFPLAAAGYWLPAVGCLMAYSFLSYGSTSHDLVHGNLGFSPGANAFWLSVIELLGLRAGTLIGRPTCTTTHASRTKTMWKVERLTILSGMRFSRDRFTPYIFGRGHCDTSAATGLLFMRKASSRCSFRLRPSSLRHGPMSPSFTPLW